MKLITNEGKEIAMDDLQSIIIKGKQKVIVYMPTTSLCELSVSNIFRTFDDFFGDGRWMLTSEKLRLEVKDE